MCVARVDRDLMCVARVDGDLGQDNAARIETQDPPPISMNMDLSFLSRYTLAVMAMVSQYTMHGSACLSDVSRVVIMLYTSKDLNPWSGSPRSSQRYLARYA